MYLTIHAGRLTDPLQADPPSSDESHPLFIHRRNRAHTPIDSLVLITVDMRCFVSSGSLLFST